MTQAEFHRRYELRPDLRAELVEGVVYVSSPTRYDLHDEQSAFIRTWLGSYQFRHPEVRLGNDATIVFDNEGEVQPDAFLFFRDPATNPPTIDDEHYLHGAPHLIVEVSASSRSYDLGPKMRTYARRGVREYIVWRVEDDAIDWFELQDGNYVRREPGDDGVVESTQFPGLRLDIAAALALDGARVLAALR
jgi:Uma2 family endonuclease